MARDLIISDLQAPGHHQDAFAFICHIDTVFKCDRYACVGDEIDASKLSVKHFPDPNGMSATEEHLAAVAFLKQLYKKFPIMKIAISNHTMRVFKKANYAGIPEIFLKSYQEFLEAPDGWQWKARHDMGSYILEHGIGYSGQMGHMKAALKNRKNTVIGHLSSYPGINYITNFEGELLWGANAGCLIDPNHQFFKYGEFSGDKPGLGLTVVINDVPIWIPMKLDKHGRWTGNL